MNFDANLKKLTKSSKEAILFFFYNFENRKVLKMDLPWGDEKSIKFITNVGLITSDGPNGPNVMAAEWTHHVSYKPGIIAISLGPTKTTTENIRKTGKFGVNIASTSQNVAASVAGGSAGRDVDKISALKELGVKFFAGKNGLPMIEGSALNIECKVLQEIPMGDHVLFIGEILDAKKTDSEPLAYHGLKYWKMTEQISKPTETESARIAAVVEKHRKIKK